MRRADVAVLAALLVWHGASAQVTAPPTHDQPPAPAPPAWVARGSADLIALDKINARATPLTIAVGQTATFGSLRITVRACDIRPPDKPPDATAFLQITDSNEGEPGFTGWMIASAPAVSMLEHPVYDVRVTGCGS